MAGPAFQSYDECRREIEALRLKLAEAENRLAEAQDVIAAIQAGEVDAVVVSRPEGDQVFTLQGAEYAYRTLVEAMNEGAATLGVDGTVLYCNQRLSDVLGIPLEQIIGSPVANLAVHRAKHEFEAFLAQARSGEPCRTEIEFLTGDSRQIPVYVSLRDMKLGEPALCMVVTDLTESKKREELVASGRLATSILDSAAEAIAVCDEIGMIISANEALENLIGFNPVFQTFESALPLELNAESAGGGKRFSIAEAMRGVTVRGQEVHLVRKHGHPVSLLLTASAIKASSGIVGCVLTMTDITERKRAEEALRASEARFRSVLDSSRDFIYRADLQTGHYEYVSPSVRNVMGFSPEELLSVGQKVSLAMVHPDDLPVVQAWLARLADTGEGELEYRLRVGNGEYRWLSNHASITKDSAGRPLYRNGSVRDITEKKTAEAALLQSEKLASVGRMASTIAHEINNPLETIGNVVYLASTDAGISPAAKSYLDIAVQELDRINHITRQTLAFHRDTSIPIPVDLRESIEGVVKFFTPRLASRDVDVTRRYADVGRIMAFGSEIQQVVSNLLSNSMDATPARGRIEIRLAQTCGNDGDKIRLTIADTGSGIHPHQLAKVFEPFFTTKEMHGTGLGLWVTKQIVEKHGGTIRVRSKLGSGTVFSIVFPIAEVAKAQ